MKNLRDMNAECGPEGCGAGPREPCRDGCRYSPEEREEGYVERHFQDVKDVGVAFHRKSGRVWICLNGIALLRAVISDGKLHIEYSPELTETLEMRAYDYPGTD